MKDQKYTVEAIVKSKRFSGYQPDFVKAILKDGFFDCWLYWFITLL